MDKVWMPLLVNLLLDWAVIIGGWFFVLRAVRWANKRGVKAQFYFLAALGCVLPALGSEQYAALVFWGLAGLFLLLGIVSSVLNARAKRQALEQERQALEFATFAFIDSQANVFARKRAQLILKDDYGLEQPAQWEREKNYIFSKVIPHHLEKLGHSPSSISIILEQLSDQIDASIENAALRGLSQNPFADIGSGIDYEQFCAGLLRKAGWDARVTKASGDQGTDIIAERSGLRLVIQCKFYTSPVGNEAVQQVVASRLHERADKAVVVSNARYTKAAQQLSATTDVLLLHHDELASRLNQLVE
jgi:restriction system protein